MPQIINPFETAGRWYKANLHTHSTMSDGPLSPAQRVEQYAAAGYSVLALTDHRKTQDITGLGNRKILVLSGIEVHPVCHEPKGWWHFTGLGVPRDLVFTDPPVDANVCIAELRAAGAAVVLAHPAWCGQEFANFQHLQGLDAIEVWNSTCDTAGRPSSESEWADALDHGWRIPAVAVDDCHHAWTEDVAEGWTWLKMTSLTEHAVIEAIRRGACYASCGPMIHDFRVADGRLRLRCSPAAKIQFVSTPGRGVRRRAEPGKRITRFAVDLEHLADWPWDYVRAVVTDEQGRKAWTGPLFPKEHGGALKRL